MGVVESRLVLLGASPKKKMFLLEADKLQGSRCARHENVTCLLKCNDENNHSHVSHEMSKGHC